MIHGASNRGVHLKACCTKAAHAAVIIWAVQHSLDVQRIRFAVSYGAFIHPVLIAIEYYHAAL